MQAFFKKINIFFKLSSESFQKGCKGNNANRHNRLCIRVFFFSRVKVIFFPAFASQQFDVSPNYGVWAEGMSYQPVLFGKGQQHCKDNKMKKNAVQTKMYPANSRNDWAYQIPSLLLEQVGNKTFHWCLSRQSTLVNIP